MRPREVPVTFYVAKEKKWPIAVSPRAYLGQDVIIVPFLKSEISQFSPKC